MERIRRDLPVTIKKAKHYDSDSEKGEGKSVYVEKYGSSKVLPHSFYRPASKMKWIDETGE